MAFQSSINTEKQLSKKENAFMERAIPLIAKAEEHCCMFMEDRNKYRRRYKNDVDQEKADWQAQIAHPLPHLAVERKASFFTDAILGSASRPLFKVRPWNNFDAIGKAAAHTKYMKQQQALMPLTDTMYKAMKNMLVDGTSILHSFWDNQIEVHEKDPVPVQDLVPVLDEDGFPIIDPLTGQPRLELKITNKKPPPDVIERADRPGITNVNIDDFWIDPAATCIDDARFIAWRKFMTLSDVKHFAKIGRFKEKNIKLLNETSLPRRNHTANNIIKNGRFSRNEKLKLDRIYEHERTDPNNPIIEIIEFYEPGKVSVIANGEIPLDLDRRVYRAKFPFVALTNLPQSGEFFGLSEYVVCERLFSHVDQMQNMIYDNWEKHLKGTTLVGTGISDISLEQLKKGEPGDVIRVGDINEIKTERPGLFDGSVVQGMSVLLQECKDALSVDGAITGASPGSEVRDSQSFEVFTRISQVTLSITVRRLQESLREMGRQWVALNKQFMKDLIRVRVAGSEALDTFENNMTDLIIDPKDPKDLPLNADVDVQLTSIADVRRDRELKQMVEGINLAIQSPNFNSEEALLQLFSKIDAFDDVLGLFEQDPQKLMQKASLNALAAGKRDPVLAGRLGGQPTMAPNGGAPAGVDQSQSLQGPPVV